jgi:hypothetical protein
MGSRIHTIAVSTLVVAAVACGDGGTGGGTPTASPTGGDAGGIAADAWLTDVCGATKGWVEDILALQQDLQANLDPSSVKALKNTMVEYFDSILAATDDMLKEIDAAGVPDVEDGEAAALAVSEGLTEARDVLQRARDDAADLPTNDAQAFNNQLQAIAQDVQTELTGVGDTMGELDSPELDRAADDVPACQELEQL